MSVRARVLVVEDDPAIREGLCDLLAFQGHLPTAAADGPSGLAAAMTGEHDLLILDVMLPGQSGLSVCAAVRAARPRVPILLLTALGSEGDVLAGFQAGCDDYVAKPFSVAQLSARLKALLRRVEGPVERRLLLGGLELDLDQLSARAQGVEVALSPRDIEVLVYLHRERHRIVSRADLLRSVWGYARVTEVETRCVDMHLVKLRRKLAELGAAGIIETVRSAGYRLVVAP